MEESKASNSLPLICNHILTIVKGGLGVGLNENVLEAYNFVVNNYKKGDELFFFGFSRGAYTVRAAAGFVGQLGVLRTSAMGSFIQHYAEYMKIGKDRPDFSEYPPWVQFTKENPDYLKESKENAVVQVIGVFDTVGSLGVPEIGHFWTLKKADTKYYEFYDTNLSPSMPNPVFLDQQLTSGPAIKHAFQALALDERRPAFSPTLWKLKDNTETQLLQCWFAGAHINVGGGDNDNRGSNPTGDREQVASIAYAWMLDRVRPYLAFDSGSLDAQFKSFDELADTPFEAKEKSTGWLDWAKKKVTPTGYARGSIDDSFSGFYWLLTNPKDRTPNRYHNPPEVTEEYVHPSVHFRQLANAKWKEPIYEPAAMRGWTRVYEEHGKNSNGQPKAGWMWVKYVKNDPSKGVENSLWEFEIGGMAKDQSLEKRLIDKSWVDSVHNEVNTDWKKAKM